MHKNEESWTFFRIDVEIQILLKLSLNWDKCGFVFIYMTCAISKSEFFKSDRHIKFC